MNLTELADSTKDSAETFHALKEKIATRKAKVGILGLGYVGLPLACAFADADFITTGFDVDVRKINKLRTGGSYIPDVSETIVSKLIENQRLDATTEFDELKEQDAIIVCVPTPLRKSKDPDVSYIVAATQEIKKRIRPGQLIVLESTTYPGTTREILLPAFERPEFKVGNEFFLGFSPERVDPGNAHFHIKNTPKVVGGITSKCRELAANLYAAAVERVFPVSTVEVAEMTKLLENTFRAINIGLVNEMAIICDKLGVSVWEVIEAAKTKPFGFMPFYPGPGIGGHCIPLDPHYLAWKVKSFNVEPRFIELADAINSRMPDFVVEKVADILNDRLGKALSRSTILLLGVAYKQNTTDCRESPAIAVIEKLKEKRANIVYHDPFCPIVAAHDGTLTSSTLSAETLQSADICVVLTEHSNVDYEYVLNTSQLLLDTRNVFKGKKDNKLFFL